MLTIRYRSVLWFAAGAAVTVALVWSLLAWRVFAAPGPGESTVVSVAPTRILDTRDPVNLGLSGPFVSAVSQKLQVTGATVPAGSTGVLLNVTVVGASAAGFLSIRPGDASGSPTTSSLNFAAGVNLPNAVQVALPVAGTNAGQIDITYDAYGVAGPTTDVLIDVVGYTTNVGIQSLVADLALKANTSDVYTKGQIDSSPANALFAGGHVTGAGNVSTAFPRFGTFTAAPGAPGSYFVRLAGFRPGCVGLIPLMLVEAVDGRAFVDAINTNCTTGDISLNVNTVNGAGVVASRAFSFTLYRQPGSTPLADRAPLAGDVVCTYTLETEEEICE